MTLKSGRNSGSISSIRCNVYVKNFSGGWVNNTSNAAAQVSTIPSVTYKDTSGTQAYAAGDDNSTSSGGGTQTAPATGGNVTATFNFDAAKSVAQGQALVEIGTVTLNADKDTQITGITLNRTGLSSDTDVSGITVWDGFNKLNVPSLVSNGVSNVSFTSPVTILAGQGKTLSIKADVAPSVTSGDQLVFTVPNNGIQSNGTVSGAFPAISNTLTTSVIQLGTLSFARSADCPSAAIDPNTTGERLAKFDIASGSVEDLSLQALTLTQSGSAADTDIANLKLYNAVTGDELGTAENLSNREATFSFSNGVTIPKGTTLRVEVRGDVLAASGRDVEFELNDNDDIQAVGQTYGTTIVNSGAGTLTSNDLSINQGSLITSLDSSTPVAANVSTTANSVPFTAIKVEASGEPIQLRKVYVNTTNTTGVINLKVLSGTSVIGSQANPTTNSAIAITPITVTPGQPVILNIQADLNGASGSYEFGLASVNSIDAVGTISGKTENLGLTAALLGNQMSVGAVGMTVNAVPGADQTVFQNQSGVTVASFDLSHDLSEPVSISSINATVTSAQSKALNTEFTNLKLVDAKGNVLTSVINNSSSISSPMVFTFNNPLMIQPNTTTRVSIVGDVLSNAPNDSLHVGIVGANDITAVGVNSGNTVTVSTTSVAANSMETDISEKGSSIDSIYNSTDQNIGSNNIMEGSTGIKLAAFTMSNKQSGNDNEASEVTKVTLSMLKVTDGSGNDVTLDNSKLSNIKLEDNTGKVYATVPYLNKEGVPTTITLSTPFEIGSQNTNDLIVYGDIANDGDPITLVDNRGIDIGVNSAEYNALSTGEQSTYTAPAAAQGPSVGINVIDPGTVQTIYPTTLTLANMPLNNTSVTTSGAIVGQFSLQNTGKTSVEVYQVGVNDLTNNAGMLSSTFTLVDQDWKYINF